MAKLPWYMKSDKSDWTKITFHPLWVWWQTIKIKVKFILKILNA